MSSVSLTLINANQTVNSWKISWVIRRQTNDPFRHWLIHSSSRTSSSSRLIWHSLTLLALGSWIVTYRCWLIRWILKHFKSFCRSHDPRRFESLETFGLIAHQEDTTLIWIVQTDSWIKCRKLMSRAVDEDHKVNQLYNQLHVKTALTQPNLLRHVLIRANYSGTG